MSHFRLKARLAFALGFVMMGTMLVGLAVLRFGNPQWAKYVYIFQAYVSPAKQPDPPTNFTGTWITWYKNGQMMNSVTFKNGRIDGRDVAWHPNGQRWWLATYEEDELHGPTYTWNQEGRKTLEGSYHRERRHGKWIMWGENGEVVLEEWYLCGKQVTAEECQEALRLEAE